jgi:hypothetical protein
MIDAWQDELAGVADWWPALKQRMVDDSGRLRAFWQTAQEFRQVVPKLPGWRARVAELRRKTAGPWARGTAQYRIGVQAAELERSQAALEARGTGLVAEVQNFLQRAVAGARGAAGLGLFQLPPLAVVLL